MKLFTPKQSLAALCLVLAFTSCKKSSTPKTTSTGPDIYIAGLDDGMAVYWKNGAETKLTDKSSQAYGEAISVGSNGNVYVAGIKSVNKQNNAVGVCWTNGTPTYLSDSTQNINSYASSLYLSGSDVYIGGYTDNGTSYATYWKNGVATRVGGVNTIAGGVYLSGTDVYLGGESLLHIGSNATYWKNGTAVNLTNIDNAGDNGGSINATFVSGSDVYMVGDTYDYYSGNYCATYWKNGVATRITTTATDAHGIGIYVVGSDIYVCGYESDNGTEEAKYWKNGVEFNLSTSGSHALGIYVFNDYVYVAGYVEDTAGASVATLWINGQATQFGAEGSSGNAIFVK
jgi:hypothetical protein